MASATDSTSAELSPLALVSGGQQGIGEAIARALACSGYDIAIADLQAGTNAVTFRERWGCKSKIFCLHVDVSSEASVASLFDELATQGYLAPDVLVNNAATQYWGPLIDMTVENWAKTLDVNLTGTFLMTREFARRRRVDGVNYGGSIINLGSGCNKLAFPNLSAYVASKGGVEMLTKASALELGPMGIRVNCIAPGAIETERTQLETDSYAESWTPLTPLRRIGTVNDVAKAVVGMVGDNMQFVSGETINVDGGLFSRAIWPDEY